jgi:hypothetical protein
MRVRGNLIDAQNYGLRAAILSQDKSVTLMHGHAAAQVRESEGILPIAAIGVADKIEKCFVLADCHYRSIAKRPAGRGKIAREQPDFSNKWL